MEGCPRTTHEGQDETCGLARLCGGQKDHSKSWPLCGSDATVDAWAAAGLLDLVPQITHDDHRNFYREGKS